MNPSPTSQNCDECRLCCEIIAVEELGKPYGVACKHLVPRPDGAPGCCGIWKTAPEPCIKFFCGWRASQMLPPKNRMPPTMRPDRCGAFFGMFDRDDDTGRKMALVVDPNRPEAWTEPEVLEYAKMYLRHNADMELWVGEHSIRLNDFVKVRPQEEDET